MKKVSLRASFAIIMALLVIVGLVLYVFRFVQDGEKWALYFDESTSKCAYQRTNKPILVMLESTETTDCMRRL